MSAPETASMCQKENCRMSANYSFRERLKVFDGIVEEVRTDESGYTVIASFEEPDGPEEEAGGRSGE